MEKNCLISVQNGKQSNGTVIAQVLDFLDFPYPLPSCGASARFSVSFAARLLLYMYRFASRVRAGVQIVTNSTTIACQYDSPFRTSLSRCMESTPIDSSCKFTRAVHPLTSPFWQACRYVLLRGTMMPAVKNRGMCFKSTPLYYNMRSFPSYNLGGIAHAAPASRLRTSPCCRMDTAVESRISIYPAEMHP